MYGENGEGYPPIFQFFFFDISNFFALIFGELHKGTPHYTRRGDDQFVRSETSEHHGRGPIGSREVFASFEKAKKPQTRLREGEDITRS